MYLCLCVPWVCLGSLIRAKVAALSTVPTLSRARETCPGFVCRKQQTLITPSIHLSDPKACGPCHLLPHLLCRFFFLKPLHLCTFENKPSRRVSIMPARNPAVEELDHCFFSPKVDKGFSFLFLGMSLVECLDGDIFLTRDCFRKVNGTKQKLAKTFVFLLATSGSSGLSGFFFLFSFFIATP
ncbi:hypothetical protein BGZ63DRAFT_186868 [Mariannaea sp. PMI_226]|nr:hypothetical protein BGZ63DRAFT_186868 [Mariannaea sp. PMI_226]